MYRPLPDELTIKDSGIEGLGLFAREDIKDLTSFGVSHILDGDNVIRTPLGGFYNHSDNPNCAKQRVGDNYVLHTIRDIDEGEELTVAYTLYNITKK